MSTSVGNLSVELSLSDEAFHQALAKAVEAANQAIEKTQSSLSQAAKQSDATVVQDAKKTQATVEQSVEKTQAVINQSVQQTHQKVVQEAQKTHTAVVQTVEKTNSAVRDSTEKTNSRITQSTQRVSQRMRNNLNPISNETFKLPSNGLLQLSRAADDLQYGLKGVVNNVEGIVTGFGGGAALAAGFTLTAIAVNAFGDDVAEAALKMMDGRSAMQRLTDQAQYASTIFGELRAKIELSTQELDKLSKYDANAGFGGWLRRQMGYDNSAMNESAAFQFATMSEQTMLDQRELSRRSTAFSKGMEFLDPVQDKERNARRAEAFTNLFDTDFKRQKLFGDLTGQLANDEFGGDFTRARQRAREILGQTALGLKEGFDIINKMTKNGLAKEDFRLSMEEAHKESKKAAEDAAKEYSKALDDQMNGLAKQFRERQKIEEQRDKIQGNIDELKLSQMRTEIIGGSDAFLRNFNAGTSEDPVVKAIDKQTEELSAVMERLKELN